MTISCRQYNNNHYINQITRSRPLTRIRHTQKQIIVYKSSIDRPILQMEAQSDHTDIRYPLPNCTHPNDLIFKARYNNDQLLLDITRLNHQNQKLKSTTQHLIQNIPAFILKWWQSNQSKEKMNTFLQQLSSALREEMEVLNRKMHEFRSQCEVNEADYAEELNLTEELQREVEQLEQKMVQLRQNSNDIRQLENIMKQPQPMLQQRYNALRKDLKIASDIREDFKRQTYARFADRLQQNNEQDYYNEIEFVLQFLTERKKLIKDKLAQTQQQNNKYTKLINAEQQQRQIKTQLKKSILQKRSQLESLNYKLRQTQNQQDLEHTKFKELEQQYCLSQMDRVVERVRDYRERTKTLMNKTVGLLSAVQQHPNIPQIESSIPDY